MCLKEIREFLPNARFLTRAELRICQPCHLGVLSHHTAVHSADSGRWAPQGCVDSEAAVHEQLPGCLPGPHLLCPRFSSWYLAHKGCLLNFGGGDKINHSFPSPAQEALWAVSAGYLLRLAPGHTLHAGTLIRVLLSCIPFPFFRVQGGRHWFSRAFLSITGKPVVVILFSCWSQTML